MVIKSKHLMVLLKSFVVLVVLWTCLLYTSDAADERSSVDLGGRRIIKKKTNENMDVLRVIQAN